MRLRHTCLMALFVTLAGVGVAHSDEIPKSCILEGLRDVQSHVPGMTVKSSASTPLQKEKAAEIVYSFARRQPPHFKPVKAALGDFEAHLVPEITRLVRAQQI